LEKAIEQFLRQDYPNKELIIIDDSEQPFSKDLSKEQAIKYIHTGVRETIGKKRNRACEIASGKIIVHLDDDDFYANDWLTEQVSFLLENDLDVTGLNAPLFYHSETLDIWQYTYPEQEKPWVYGATLCYTKSFWESNPFRETNLGEDNYFVWNNKKVKLRAHPSLHSYLGNIHPGNTSQKRLKDERWKKVEKDKIPDLKFVLDHKNETKPEDRTNLNTIYK
jgi:glycosyltransferase involved in cell wall biosynthesis